MLSILVLRQSFKFKLFECKRFKHLHSTIDVSSEIWNHSVALKNRYYKLFGKGLPKAKLQGPYSQTPQRADFLTGKRSVVKASRLSSKASISAWGHSSRATSSVRQRSANAASTDRSPSSKLATSCSATVASRSWAKPIVSINPERSPASSRLSPSVVTLSEMSL